MFQWQDREARAADFRAAEPAGLVHLLHQQQGVPSTPEPEPLEPPEPGSAARNDRVPLLETPDTTSPAVRARNARRRWAARDRRSRVEQGTR